MEGFMKRACIAIVDAARARIYTYEANRAGGPGDGTLHERIALVNPGRRGHNLVSTTKPGIKRVSPGGGSTDDHRDAHMEQLEHNFAKHVIGEVDRLARERGYAQVIVVTPPKMLGELRKLDGLQRPHREVEYVERD